MKTVLAIGCGVAVGIVGCAVWFWWYFKDVYK
jgi:hypothetical protein